MFPFFSIAEKFLSLQALSLSLQRLWLSLSLYRSVSFHLFSDISLWENPSSFADSTRYGIAIGLFFFFGGEFWGLIFVAWMRGSETVFGLWFLHACLHGIARFSTESELRVLKTFERFCSIFIELFDDYFAFMAYSIIFFGRT